LLDFGVVIVSRLIKGKSPVWGDRGHLHHKLLAMGWGKRRVALFYWLTAVVLGWVALKIDARKKLLIMLGLGGLMVLFLTWKRFFYFFAPRGRDNG